MNNFIGDYCAKDKTMLIEGVPLLSLASIKQRL
jgi:hypothetical protein